MFGFTLLAVVALAAVIMLTLAGEAGYTDVPLRDSVIVSVQPPIDTTGAALTTEYVSFRNYTTARIIIHTGAWAGGNMAITLNEATAVAGTGAQALAFNYMYTNSAAATSPILVKTAVTSDTFNVGTANSIWQIIVHSSELSAGFDCLSVAGASPGANADLIAVTIEMSGARYPAATGDMLNPVVD